MYSTGNQNNRGRNLGSFERQRYISWPVGKPGSKNKSWRHCNRYLRASQARWYWLIVQPWNRTGYVSSHTSSRTPSFALRCSSRLVSQYPQVMLELKGSTCWNGSQSRSIPEYAPHCLPPAVLFEVVVESLGDLSWVGIMRTFSTDEETSTVSILYSPEILPRLTKSPWQERRKIKTSYDSFRSGWAFPPCTRRWHVSCARKLRLEQCHANASDSTISNLAGRSVHV